MKIAELKSRIKELELEIASLNKADFYCDMDEIFFTQDKLLEDAKADIPQDCLRGCVEDCVGIHDWDNFKVIEIGRLKKIPSYFAVVAPPELPYGHKIFATEEEATKFANESKALMERQDEMDRNMGIDI